MLPVAEPTSLTERNQNSKYFNNTILQKNKAALILMVPVDLPLSNRIERERTK